MTTPNSGKIKASDIINEFGSNFATSGNAQRTSLGNYRKISNDHEKTSNHSYSSYPHEIGELSFSSLDGSGNIPTSGNIRLSDFYGTKLQQVVNFYSSGSGGTRLNAKARYNDNETIGSNNKTAGSGEHVVCVGNHRSRPSESSGTKVHIHVNQTIGSEKSEKEDCALKTGSGWESGTELRVDVGGEGRIQGAGGNGGKGSEGAKNGNPGKFGTAGLGIQYQGTVVSIASGGIVRCGYGGGGGGGGAHDHDFKSERRVSGGGGGGGAGIPVGNGGGAGTNGEEGNGGAGENASTDHAGEGGSEKNSGGQEAESGKGGHGGDASESGEGGNSQAEDGFEGEGGEGSGGEGGERGARGAAIRRTSGVTFSFASGTSIPTSSGGNGNNASQAPTGVK